MLKTGKSLIKNLVFKTQSVLFEKLIRGKNAWRLYDKAGIPGFGRDLIRLYFPIYYDKNTARNSFSADSRQQITKKLNADSAKTYHQLIAAAIETIVKLPLQPTGSASPYLDNYYFGIFDAAILAAMLQTHKPSRIVEIGSGISTRYIRYFTAQFRINSQIVCIDPSPRVEIEDVADLIIKAPFENVIADEGLALKSGDIVFMDGSHYVFQGNDTLNFFFNLLPSLAKGVIIHIHDIYLPFEYAENVERQLWTEQYILAAMILGGFSGFEVLYPAYFMSQTDQDIKNALAVAGSELNKNDFNTKLNHTEGYSFWIRKI